MIHPLNQHQSNLFSGNARHPRVSDVGGANFVIVRVCIIPQNSVCVGIKFDCNVAMAASFFRVNLAMPAQILFFVLFLAPGHLARADINPPLGLERSPMLNHGKN